MSARLFRKGALALLLLGQSCLALALEFQSVAEPGAVLYDGPSTKSQKLFILTAGYPVEIIVKVEGWVRVRDQSGQFAWIESSRLSDRNTVMVSGRNVEAKKAPNDNAPVVFAVEPDVYLELIEVSAGWANVRHTDGSTGYIKIQHLWGL
jgi:SH3-like domain-containing protein